MRRNRMARTVTTVMVALAVVLSVAVIPAAGAGDDGLLGGDDADEEGGLVGDGTTVGGDSGVSVGEDGVSAGGDDGVSAGEAGVSVGGDDGVNASTDGVSVAGQEIGDESLPGRERAPELPDEEDTPSVPGSDDAPVETDGSNVAVGGGDGVTVGTDGVRVAGEEISRDYLNSGEGEINPIVVAETDEGPGGSEADLLLAGVASSERARLVPRADISGNDRTYLDLDGDGTANRNGIKRTEAAVFTMNESGGQYLLVLDEDLTGSRTEQYVGDENVAVTNNKWVPGTRGGNAAAFLFPAALQRLGPSLPVGPEAPERAGGGAACESDECRSATFGVNESVPENRATEPVKANYPFPRSTDTSGVGGVPCGKPVNPSDLPLERAPGISDLPSGTLPGVPTSLLTNDAIASLAFGAAPDPCTVTDPVAEPAADPAVEPGAYEPDPEVDADGGSIDTDDEVHVIHAVEIGPANGAGTADGIYALRAAEDEQIAIQELDVSDTEYEYLLLETRSSQRDGTASGTTDVGVREDMDPSYLGVAADGTNELGTSNGEASVTVEVFGSRVGGSVTCDGSECQPDYSGLPKFGGVPSVPNPLGGSVPVPGLESLAN